MFALGSCAAEYNKLSALSSAPNCMTRCEVSMGEFFTIFIKEDY